jgi:hypothetical protein
MGAWHHVLARFNELGWKLPSYAGRPAQASPAVGSLKRHGKEQALVVASALGTAGAAKAPASKTEPKAGTAKDAPRGTRTE